MDDGIAINFNKSADLNIEQEKLKFLGYTLYPDVNMSINTRNGIISHLGNINSKACKSDLLKLQYPKTLVPTNKTTKGMSDFHFITLL